MCVCARTPEEVLVCVCVWRGAGGVFEEMTRVLKNYAGVKRGSEMLGLLKFFMMMHRTRSGDNNHVF